MIHLAVGLVFIISSFAEATLTIIMAASLPIPRVTSQVSDGSAIDRMSRAGSRASTAFWHDRGRPEDMEAMKNSHIPRHDIASTVVVSSGPTADWHRQVLPPARDPLAIPYGVTTTARGPHPKLRDSKASLFERTWSTISSALRDLEPVWAHRRMEAAMGRPYTPSVYSSRTTDDDSTSTTRGDVNHIINRLSDIVEESWRDRSILKTPEPAALTYATERRYSPYRGSRSDWDIENGSMI